jgi:hypothetical protein
MDFTQAVQEMGIGFLNLFKKRKAVNHMTALSISLWKLALERSFPQDADAFFTCFLESGMLGGVPVKRQQILKNLVQTYLDLLADKKDTDFSGAARYLADALTVNSVDKRTFCLRVSLYIRKLYNFIFEKLI